MAGEDQQAVTLLSYRTDTASVASAIQANRAVEASINAVKGAATAGGGALRFDTAEQAAAALGINVQKILGTEEAITAEKQQQLTLANLQLDIARQQQAAFVDRQGSGGGFGAGVSKASRALFNLPDVQLGGGLSSTVVSRLGLLAGGGIEAAGVGLAAVGAAAAVAAPLVIGLVGVVNAYGQATERATARATSFTEAFKTALEAGTQAQIDELIKRQQNEIRIAEITRDLLLEKQAQAPDQLSNFLDNSSRDLSSRLNQAAADIGLGGAGGDFSGQNVETAQSYNAAIEEQKKVIADGQIALEAYNVALGENFITAGESTVAADELADAERELAAARRDAQLANADFVLEVSRLTEEERKARAERIEEDIRLLTQEIESGNAQGEAADALTDRVLNLNGQYLELTTTTNTYADSLAREEAAKQALTDRNQQILDLVGQEVKAREDLFEVQQKAADIVAKRDEDIADLRTDIADRAAQREEDLGEKRADIAENSADRIAKIERDAARSRQTSIGERDAYGFKQAEQRRADALTDESANGSKQLANLIKQAQKAERVEASSLDKRIAKITETANRAVEVENRKAAYLNNVIATSLTSQAFLTQNGMSSVVNTVATGWNAVVNYTTQAFNNILAATSARLTSAAPFPTLTSSIGAAQPSSQFNVLFDARLNQALNGASGNRLVRG